MTTADGHRAVSAMPGADVDGVHSAENTCPDCGGSGRAGVGGAPCSTCDGEGVVVDVVGDA